VEAIKKVLVTGASGHLGSDVVAVLSRSFKVIAVTKSHDITCKNDKVVQIRLDLSGKEAIDKIAGFKPEAIIHTAAMTNVDTCQLHPRQAWQNNVAASEHVVKAAQACGAKLIHISTDHVFDGNKAIGYIESDVTDPVNIYGATKLEAEHVVSNFLQDFIILRVSWLFGNPKLGFLNYVLESAGHSSQISIVSDKRSSPTYTFDAALALEYLLSREDLTGQILHFTNTGEGCSWLEYAHQILNCAGLDKVALKPVLLKDLNLPAPRPMNSVLDNSKFSKIYNQPIRNWQEALKECISSRYLMKPKVMET
jgi:dTDP-4-dehydrorhamnose reductase